MKDLDNEEAGVYKQFAAMDAEARSKANEVKYTQKQKDKAHEMLAALYGSGMNLTRGFINYRENFITVKAKFDREIYMRDDSVVKFTKKAEEGGHKVKRMIRSKSLVIQLKV